MNGVVIGLDLSLTSTGLVALASGNRVVAQAVFSTQPDHDMEYDDIARMHRTVSSVLTYVVDLTPVLVALERGIYGHGDSRPHELNGIVKYALWQRGQRMEFISPNSLKLAATGNGRASKAAMIEAAADAGIQVRYKASGAYADGMDDVADAYHLARWGRRILAG